jgi:Abortive infection alpha
MSANQDNALQALPGLARIAAAASWRVAGWALDMSLQTTSRVMQAAVSGEPPAQFFRDAGSDMRKYVRTVLGILDDAVSGPSGPPPDAPDDQPETESATARSAASVNGSNGTDESLRERGAQLLRDSADVDLDDDIHPAYAQILDQLAPDEGRILRLLAAGGPQPAVDVRTGRPLNVGSELVAPGLSMIGAEAGVRHLERVHAYLNNLNRLGLVWFSREPLTDPLRYQVLEVQPEVLEAMKRAGRGKTIRRSIHLTPFGEDFCATVLESQPPAVSPTGQVTPVPPSPQ